MPTAGNDTIVGDTGRDTLTGFDGNDNLVGGAGGDVFREGRYVWEGESTSDLTSGETYEFGRGDDRIWGGKGFDVLSYAGTEVDLQVFAGRGVTLSDLGEDRFRQIELLLLGGGDDRVSGGQETLAVSMRAGNDTLWLTEAIGAYSGGSGVDYVRVRDAIGVVDIDLSRDENTIGDQVFYLRDFESVQGATDYSNTITGNGRANFILGGDQDDKISGKGGRDRLYGGDGDDMLFGGKGFDRIIAGGGDDIIRPGNGDGYFEAEAGDDIMVLKKGRAYAGDGNDELRIKNNANALTVAGGDGADTFVFGASVDEAWVEIQDFAIGEDLLDIAGVDALADITGVEQVGRAARLSIETPADTTIVIRLMDTAVADLSDSIFA